MNFHWEDNNMDVRVEPVVMRFWVDDESPTDTLYSNITYQVSYANISAAQWTVLRAKRYSGWLDSSIFCQTMQNIYSK